MGEGFWRGPHSIARQMLKPIDSLLDPDPRYEIMARLDSPIVGGHRPMQIGDMHQLVSPIVLNEYVPVEISQQFDLARVAFIYSWFAYELATLAEQQAYSVLEMALRKRAEAEAAPPKRRGLAALLKLATNRGWLRHEEFEMSWPGSTEKMSLLELLPHFRNELAHGSTNLFPQGSLEMLQNCALIINKLYVASSSEDPAQG